MTSTEQTLGCALETVGALLGAHVALGFTVDTHQTIDRIVMRCPRPEDELAVTPLLAKLPALEPIDPFSPRRADAAGAAVMWAAHVGGDEIAAASMYGRHLRRHGFATPICAYFRRDGRITVGMTLLRRLGMPLFDARAVRLLSEWQPFLQDALTPAGMPVETQTRPALTNREAAVAALVATGSSNADVAAELGMTEGTVKAHLTKVYAKLGVRNRTQLAVTLPRAAVVDEPVDDARELTSEPTFG